MTNHNHFCYQTFVKYLSLTLCNSNSLMYFSITMKTLCCFFLFIISSYNFGQNQKITPTKIDTITIDADSFVGFDGFHNYFYIKETKIFGFSYKKKTKIEFIYIFVYFFYLLLFKQQQKHIKWII